MAFFAIKLRFDWLRNSLILPEVSLGILILYINWVFVKNGLNVEIKKILSY